MRRSIGQDLRVNRDGGYQGASPYWQHNEPIKCPKGHTMGWLGSVYWICGKGKCNTIYVQTTPKQ